MRNGKWIAIGVLVVLMVVLGVFLIKHQKEEQKQAAIYQEIDNQIRPLKVKKQQLTKELENLIEDYEAKHREKATAQVIYTEMSPQVYELCYPLMKERNFAGVLALSPTQLPGADGCMSIEQFETLVEQGWTTCIKWKAESNVNEWLPALKNQLSQLNIEVPNIVYFPKNTYKTEMDTQIKSLGFEIVVHHENTAAGHALIQTQYEEGLWHLGALGLMGSRTKVRFDEAIRNKGNIIYLVGFKEEDELYEERSYTVMLDYFKSYSDDQLLVVGTMEDARAHYYSRQEEVSEEEKTQYLQQKGTLEAEIADLEAQINELQWQ